MSGDYLADLRIRIEPGPGAVASLRGVLLVVPSIEPGQEKALDALLSAATDRPVLRAVARVVADFDRGHLPAFCLVVEGEDDGPFALVHGPVVLTARGDGDDVRLDGLDSRFWVDHALPRVVEHLAVHVAGDGPAATGRLVLEATVAAAGSGGAHDDTPDADTPVLPVPFPVAVAVSVSGPVEAMAEPLPEPVGEPVGEPVAEAVESPAEPGASRSEDSEPAETPAARVPETVPDATSVLSAVPAAGGDEAVDDALAFGSSPSATAARAAAAVADNAVAPADSSSGQAVMAAPAVALAGGSSSVGFRPEPIRFGQGGRMEAVESPSAPTAPPATVNGWHEESKGDEAPAPAPSGSDDDSPFAAPAESPFAAAARSPFAPPAPPAPAPADAPGLPTRLPRSSAPPQAATQLVGPPSPGLFSGAVPPPVHPGFDPFSPGAPRPPEQDFVLEPAGAAPAGGPATARGGLGRLVMENGPDVVVDADCVIGRNPEVDPDVAQGRAKPVVLPDAEQRISRVHARLVFTAGGVEIVDAGSVNGTWIEPPGGAGWIAMVPRVPAPLPLGSRIQVGDLVLSYLPVNDA